MNKSINCFGLVYTPYVTVEMIHLSSLLDFIDLFLQFHILLVFLLLVFNCNYIYIFLSQEIVKICLEAFQDAVRVVKATHDINVFNNESVDVTLRFAKEIASNLGMPMLIILVLLLPY